MDALNLETAMLILEKFDAISVTNARGEYIYANQNWLNTFHLTLNDITGKHPWDIVPDTKVREVLRTHRPIIGYTLQSKDTEGFVSYYPIMRGQEFFGVMIWVFYTWMDTALKFSQMVARLSQELESTKTQLKTLSAATYTISNIIGESPAMVKLREEIEIAARSSSTVLIEGETGVGKELIAHAIHNLSARSDRRFVRVNCSAIPIELAESELFGYEEGAFTGARRGGKPGKFELADGGGIFLDEMNQLPLTIQPKLLRVLQEREIERVGGKDPIPVDIRLIAATNVPLEQLVQTGEFRRDLYYRINVIKIRVPPLRERKEDIPLLTKNLIARLNHQLGFDISDVDDAVFDRLKEYDWPGNIRELQNALEAAMNHAEDDALRVEDFDVFFADMNRTTGGRQKSAADKRENSLYHMKADLDYEALREAMLAARGNKTEAARRMGISRNALYKKLRKYSDLR